MTTTSIDINDELRLTMLKHLASGKTLDQVATIVGKPRPLVLDVVSKHGYPNSIPKGIEVLTKKIERDNALPPARPRTAGQVETPVPPQAQRPPATPALPQTAPIATITGGSDTLRALIATGKTHSSKRIQAAADRALDAIAKLRHLLTEEEAKNAEKRRLVEERATRKAEVDRLEQQLADARAALRGTAVASTTAGPDAKSIRTWAADNNIDCPAMGKVPTHVRDAYTAAHPQQDGAA